MANGDDKVIEKITNSVITTGMSRAMILFGVPLMLWFVAEAYTSLKDMSKANATTGSKIDLLTQEFKLTLESAKGDIAGMKIQLNDHEGRLRVIERGPR